MAPPSHEISDDALLWLEEVMGEKPLSFAREHNTRSEGRLTAAPGFKALEERLFSIYTTKDRIPAVAQRNEWLYNFWTDAEHPRGLWRRTRWAEFRKANPQWEVLLDIDALNKQEGKSWVFAGASGLYPKYERYLIQLSEGGGDAVEVREFDLKTKGFAKDGFYVPPAKTDVAWKDENTLWVGTDFGEGTLTTSGYPRLVKEWRRGTPLSAATLVFEVGPENVAARGWRDFDHGRKWDFVQRAIDFEHSELFLVRDGKKLPIEKPLDAEAGIWDDQLLLQLRSEWKINGAVYAKGALLITPVEAFLRGERKFQTLFTPAPNAALSYWTGTRTRLVTVALVDVKSEVKIFQRDPSGVWKSSPLSLDSPGMIQLSAVDSERTDDAWLWKTDFIQPNSLALYDTATGKHEALKQGPTQFDATGLRVSQNFATSKDGTRIPYFQIERQDRKGPSPTLLTAYGGFEVSLLPAYDATAGAAWIERGGVYVQANLRGGGEYGPAWHEAAMKSQRHRAFEDFIAVAEDLVKRQVTTPAQLGIEGGSNGGLLTSVMLTKRPELFGAIVSQVPLTDMRRFHKLLAGASWMGEYGDPDKEEDWKTLSTYSPFHNVKPAGEVKYPPVLYTSSTRDDRVHPGHARKLVAKLEALGHSPLYYENIEGGHGGAADARQSAHLSALVYTFLAQTLGLGEGK